MNPKELAYRWMAKHPHQNRLSGADVEEIVRIARGLDIKGSAEDASLSRETIRQRRKSIYRKLKVEDSRVVLYQLLCFALERAA